MSPRQIEILKSEVNKMLELKIIEPGESDFTSPLILVEAQGKEARPCIDYRRLNKVTRTQFFPLPNIEELLEKVSAAKYISILNLTRGYWQIPLSPRAQRYASFVTTFGTFKPLRLPFGLKNAPYYFSRLMANLLRNCEDFAVPCLDDIAIFSLAWDDHLKHLKDVFDHLRSAKLHIKPSKCQFAQAYVKYLGHLVGQGLRTPGELKVQVIKDFPIPTNKTQGRNRKSTVDWNSSCQNAFEELKTRLSKNPVLYSPDFTKPFIIQCDASNLGIGVVLSQVCENEEHPIMFLSKKLSLAEQKYSTTEKECAAIIFAVQKLKCYLDGHQKIVIQTDHNPLVWLEKNTGTKKSKTLKAVILAPDEGCVETSWKSSGGTDADTAIGNTGAQMLVKLLERLLELDHVTALVSLSLLLTISESLFQDSSAGVSTLGYFPTRNLLTAETTLVPDGSLVGYRRKLVT
ncbi:retrovirus-related Pol polyprotein from transposon 17.6 [Trichonephila clavipes]|nr:retrovirus-related Pol polyprotein from transposon 17.6 [Trichonephila clavipes]